MTDHENKTLPGISAHSLGQSRTVALFGEVLADQFPDRSVLGGAPFNVARHLQAFGFHPVLITRIGSDDLRDELLDTMARFGMDTLGVQSDPAHPTGRVIVHMESDGHRFEISPDQAYDYIHAGLTRMVALPAPPEMVYFGTLAQRHPVSRRALNSLLRSTDALRMLDINLRDPWVKLETVRHSLHHADLVKMNDEELTRVSQMLKISAQTPQGRARALIEQFSLDRVLITCGAQGAWQMAADGSETHVDSAPLAGELVDTVGAGDGFASVAIAGILLGWAPATILARANQFAATLCQIRGAIPHEQAFYQPFLQEWTA